MRTCVGCRERAAKQDLLRVVASGTDAGLAVVPDPVGRALGRGAHLHPTPECLGLALRRRAFPRALRVKETLAIAPLQEYLHRQAQR